MMSIRLTASQVAGFYAHGNSITRVDEMTREGPFGNFWGLEPQTITVTHNEASGTWKVKPI